MMRRNERYLSISLLTLLAWLVPGAAIAQFDSATVLGIVHDESQAAVAGATVTLTNTATGIEATTVTGGAGSYQFLNVRVGTYAVEADLQGFSTARASNVTVTVSARQRVDLTLKVGGIGETIEVTGATRTIESEASDRGQVIGRERIVNLPLNGVLRVHGERLHNFAEDGLEGRELRHCA